jgi:hypothetical protein
MSCSRASSPTVDVVEVIAERGLDDPPEIPWHLAGQPGSVRIQLRSTLRRVIMGAGLARRPELVAATRALPDAPTVVTSPVGGTFIVGGPGWLGLAAVGVPHEGQPMPLDWMTDALHRWLVERLAGVAETPTLGRVEGAWCPGFSDIAVGGRKLAGLGFRVTRGWVVMRGVLAVRAIDDADWALLAACHRLIDVDIVREAATSLVESTGDNGWTVERAIARLSGGMLPPMT